MNNYSLLLIIYTRLKTFISIWVNKNVLNNLNYHLYICLYSFLSFLFTLALVILNSKNIQFNELYDHKIIPSIILNSILGISGFYVYLYLTRHSKVSEWISISTGVNICLSVLLGYCIFKEPINFKKILGILVIYVGILIVQSEK